MAKEGVVCIDCHGNMLAVGGVGQATLRYPWVDLPMCQSCHTGDTLNNYDGQLIRRTAYADSPDIATFIVPSNKRFAETPVNPGYPGKYGFKLYKNGLGHGDMACESCHGSPHAEWPTWEANDNLAAQKIQGHEGTIIESSACHGNKLPLTLGGPHGMHNVNSQEWVNGHEEFFKASLRRAKRAIESSATARFTRKQRQIVSFEVKRSKPFKFPKRHRLTVPCAMRTNSRGLLL
jgi:hypothetical protein